jgi:hypothetical protein
MRQELSPVLTAMQKVPTIASLLTLGEDIAVTMAMMKKQWRNAQMGINFVHKD